MWKEKSRRVRRAKKHGDVINTSLKFDHKNGIDVQQIAYVKQLERNQ